jgi:hypothetical protein
MTVRLREPVLAVLSGAAGLAIAVIDSRPGWDDTGITAGLLAVAAFVVTVVAGRRPWLWALLVGVWTPLAEIPSAGGAGSLLALAIAGMGAYAGYGLVRLFVRPAEG